MPLRFLTYLAPGYPAGLFEALAGAVGAELSFETARSGPAPDDDPFADGRADVGWVCTTSLAGLGPREPGYRSAGLAWAPDDPATAGRPEYHADVVVRADDPARTVDDLRGRSIGGNDSISLSGNHALRLELGRRGEDADRFADLVLTGGHHASLDLLVTGDLDAAVVDSVVRLARSRRDPDLARLRVLARLGPWPTQPLVVATRLPEDAVTRVVADLLAAGERPDVQAALEFAGLTRLVPVGPDHCEPVARALRAATPARV